MSNSTFLLKDIYSGPNSSDPQNFFSLGNGKTLFTAYDSNGYELWVTDGTSDGTTQIDIYSGTSSWGGPNSSSPQNFFSLGNGKTLFTAYDGNGYELWVTDGTSDGTTLFKDIYSGTSSWGGPNNSSPRNFFSLGNGKTLFSANDGNGSELWVTDGTSDGTTLFKDIYSGTSSWGDPNSSSPRNFFSLGNGKTLFTANDGNGSELWVTDGTSDGTTLVKDIYSGTSSWGDPNSSDPQNFFSLGNGKTLFTAYDGNGYELWVTDGTSDGTTLVKDIYSGTSSWGGPNNSSPRNFFSLGNGKTLFTAYDGNGSELWVTDGTSDGTTLFKDIYSGTSSWGSPNTSSPQNFFSLGNGKTLFTAYDSNGYELWVTDGTSDGTTLFKDIYSGTSSWGDPNSSEPQNFFSLGNGKALFTANDGNGYELWVTDGTPDTTTDNDIAGFTLNQTNLNLSEDGTPDSFSVQLTSQPTSNVVLNIANSDSTEATVTSALTFTPDNWDTPQTVTVTGVDDHFVDGTQAGTLTVTVDAANSDDAFDDIANQTVNFTTTDNDIAGFTLNQTNVSLNEDGTPDSFSVQLTSQPTSNVVLNIANSDSTEATVTSSLTFTPDNWDTPQTVTVTGVDDHLVDGTQSGTLTVTVDAANSDDAFDDIANQTVNFTTTDNDIAGFSILLPDFPTSIPANLTCGAEGNDTLIGDGKVNNLCGGGGNDEIKGLAQSDFLAGDEGNDRLFGNTENDTLDGGNGNDSLWGGSGNDFARGGLLDDLIRGEGGADRLDGDAGNDSIYGDIGNDTIWGGQGNDSVWAGNDNDVVKGDVGNDNLSGEGGNDTLTGDDGNDRILGNTGRDLMDGNLGNDRLFGGDGNDTILGSAGWDILSGDLGDDLLIGGAERDRFDFRLGHGHDIIADFQDGVDLIGLADELEFSQLQIVGVGNDTQIIAHELNITLQNVPASSINSNDFVLV